MPLWQRVLDDRLDRREAGARGDEDDRLVRVLAQEEGAERPLEAQDVALLHLAEHVVGELPAGDVAHVQLDQLVVVRRIGHREAAPRAVLEQELDVLAGEELQALVGRQLQVQHHHVVGEPLQLLHAAGQRLHLDVLRVAPMVRASITRSPSGLRLAEERLALRLLLVGQRLLLVHAVVDLPFEELALAAAAGAVAAAIGQDDLLAQRGGEDGLRPPRPGTADRWAAG